MRISGNFRREITLGGITPRRWQIAWSEPRRGIAVYCPVPFHWILRAWREFSYRVGIALKAPAIEQEERIVMQREDQERQRIADEYSRGYMAGWRECFQTCVDAIEDEMAQSEKVWDIGTLLAGSDDSTRPSN